MLAAAVSSSTLMQSAWQLIVLWGIVVGLGSGAMALVLGATVAARWFVRRRGLMTGLFAASAATGQLVFLPLQAAIIAFVGWRTAVLLVAGVAVMVAVIVAIFMRDDPRQIGMLAYGADSSKPEAVPSPRPGGLSANPFKLALQTLVDSARVPDFWFLAGSFAICGITTVGLISVHLIPASVDHGMTEITAASMLAAMGIFDLIGTTASGWLSDRIDPRKLLVWYYTLRGLALLFLPAAYDLGAPALAAFVVFYGLDWVATVPPTVKLVSERFGPVFGWIFAAHQLGGSAAAFGGGLIHTWQGDYLLAWLIAGGLSLLAAGLVLGVRGELTARTPSLPLEPARV
jgi:predicted MFS family arabinose efflux permease